MKKFETIRIHYAGTSAIKPFSFQSFGKITNLHQNKNHQYLFLY
jgi:hypothetical protein